MRPRSEIRVAIEGCIPAAPADDVAPTNGVTWRDVAGALHRDGIVDIGAPSELKMVRRTVENMATAGDIRKVGSKPVPGARRQMTTYARANGWMSGSKRDELGSVLHGWVSAF